MKRTVSVDSEVELENLIRENQTIISNLTSNGANCSGDKHFEFSVSLKSQEEVRRFKELFRANAKRPENSMTMSVNDPKDFRFGLLIYKLDIDVVKISEIEIELRKLASQFENAEVSWEFKE